jgi:hypothetical protein
MFQPVQVAFGEFLHEFYRQVAPTTVPLQEYAQRGFARSAVWAAGRMVDQADEMLGAWQRNASDPGATRPFKLPVLMVALGKGFEPIQHDFGIQHADPIWIEFPGDPKERLFRVRLLSGDLRAQIAIFSSDAPSAQSLASQLLLYLDSPAQRRFFARHRFADLDHHYPVQISLPDAPAIAVETGQSNMTCLAIDIILKATVPLFMAPRDDEPNDGRGTPGNPDDPHGYPRLVEVRSEESAP